MQCTGLGGLVPNTLVLNMPVSPDDEQIETFVNNIKLMSALGKSVIIFKDIQNFCQTEAKNETIDI